MYINFVYYGYSRYISSQYNKGITVFKIFIWGGILSDIQSEIRFYGDV